MPTVGKAPRADNLGLSTSAVDAPNAANCMEKKYQIWARSAQLTPDTARLTIWYLYA